MAPNFLISHLSKPTIHRHFSTLWQSNIGNMVVAPSPVAWPPSVSSTALAYLVPSGYDKHSYWKWPLIVDLPIENGDFP